MKEKGDEDEQGKRRRWKERTDTNDVTSQTGECEDMPGSTGEDGVRGSR